MAVLPNLEVHGAYDFAITFLDLLKFSRKIHIGGPQFATSESFFETFLGLDQFLQFMVQTLIGGRHLIESEAIQHVREICFAETDLGGLGLAPATSWYNEDVKRHIDNGQVGLLIDAWITTVNAAEQAARTSPTYPPLKHTNPEARPMTIAEKILAHHAFSIPSYDGVRPGDLVRVTIDWVISSEVTWMGMLKSTDKIGIRPKAWRNDRFWLMGDHIVDPRNYDTEKSKWYMKALDTAKHELKMTDDPRSNFSILHTEFVRERAEPGMLVLGADSHTCSAGAVGCLSIGLGACDVMMGLVTGQSWFKIPETIRVNFTGKPNWYIRGKDVVLFILRELRRNTYAADRVVEFGGPGAQYLSVDSRFAICNMCTELGAITGIFVPDAITRSYIQDRRLKHYKSNSTYFAPDEVAEYTATFNIDLSHVESFIAIHPNPDDVYPVTEKLGMRFDGCFIGACTTTEEDLVLAALVLEAGLKRGLLICEGKRVVVPGSLPIVKNLKKLGLLDIYEQCGFERPAPGCSLCLGMSADVADENSNWLSSQNRNFKNRMGKGSVGHICSAATVAASSFSMVLEDPTDLLKDVSEARYIECLQACTSWRRRPNKSTSRLGAGPGPEPDGNPQRLEYVEPNLAPKAREESSEGNTSNAQTSLGEHDGDGLVPHRVLSTIRGKVYRFGDFIDTDAIIPAPFCTGPADTDEALGSHCFEYVDPGFREYVRSGHTVVVGGKAFGCGSSREEAPRALQGAGVQCVIAKTFSFIFGRNMPNIGLIGINITDDDFYHLAETGAQIEVDVANRRIRIGGRSFLFQLHSMELELVQNRGLAEAFRRYSGDVYEALTAKKDGGRVSKPAELEMDHTRLDGLQW